MAARAAEAIEVTSARGGGGGGGGGDNDDSLTVTEGMGPMAARGAQGQSKVTPHDVDAHPAPENIWNTSTLALMHQPRSWLNAEASMNILRIVVTPEISHPLMSSSKDAAPGQLKQ